MYLWLLKMECGVKSSGKVINGSEVSLCSPFPSRGKIHRLMPESLRRQYILGMTEPKY